MSKCAPRNSSSIWVFSIAIDSSNDITRTKSLSVNILYLDQGFPKWSYLDSLFLESFRDKSIHQGLLNLFNKLQLDYKKYLVGFCSDGAETLKSSQNGVFRLLKKEVPSILGIHCIANVFNLTYKTDLVQQFPVLNDIFDLTYSTYK